MHPDDRIPYQRQSDKDLEEVKEHLAGVVQSVAVIANNITWIRTSATFIGACLVVVLPFCVAYAVWLHGQVDAVGDRVAVLEGVKIRGEKDHKACHKVVIFGGRES